MILMGLKCYSVTRKKHKIQFLSPFPSAQSVLFLFRSGDPYWERWWNAAFVHPSQPRCVRGRTGAALSLNAGPFEGKFFIFAEFGHKLTFLKSCVYSQFILCCSSVVLIVAMNPLPDPTGIPWPAFAVWIEHTWVIITISNYSYIQWHSPSP